MAKKKKTRKKTHRSTAVRPMESTSVTASPVAASQPSSAPLASPLPTMVAATRKVASASTGEARWAYVGRDVRTIGILIVLCVGAELVLSYLFSHTGLGSSVYSLIKL